MSNPPGFCDDCFKGLRHEGEPEGKFEDIGGVKCYVGTPSGDYARNKVVLFLTDVFGLSLINNKASVNLLVDDFARHGYWTVAPDILNDDPIVDFNSPTFNRELWFSKHGRDSWIPVVDKVVEALKAQGVTRIGTTGYCFGAPPAFYLALKNESHVTVVTHPSLLKVPEDIEQYKAESKAPLLINSCEVDRQFPPEAQAKTDEILGNGKFAPGYERTYWDGCTHGFAVRGDLSNTKVKAGKEGAFKATVSFYNKYL
ncbi:alpha/beta-hydrolase [Panus rudis PR-1116 ss-1]|nr:alpha/beta-hydrolase [Panus rudis PR-1116 ss-1]